MRTIKAVEILSQISEALPDYIFLVSSKKKSTMAFESNEACYRWCKRNKKTLYSVVHPNFKGIPLTSVQFMQLFDRKLL